MKGDKRSDSPSLELYKKVFPRNLGRISVICGLHMATILFYESGCGQCKYFPSPAK